MIFKRAVQRYGQTPEPETPYQRAGQVWDERIGSARVQARNWRLMAFGCLAITGGLSAALVWQSVQSRITPYVVEVDRLGEVRAVSEAEAGYHPTDPQIAWHLSRFIANVRGRSLDPVLVRQDWLEAYDFTTKRGAQFLGDYARAADPFASIGERTVSVQVTSVVRASDRSFQVKWTEAAYERGAQGRDAALDSDPDRRDAGPHRCGHAPQEPACVYVDAVDWSRELDPPAQARPAPPPVAPPPVPTGLPFGSPLDPNLAAPTQPAKESRP